MTRLTRPATGYVYLIAVFAISQALLLFNLSRAPLMFDESFYVRAAREFLAGQATSNAQHPPLAKYLIAASIRIFGDTPFGWRFPSTLAGAIIAAAIFGITCRLTRSRRIAIVAWLLTIAGGFWLVMGRIACLSIYEFAFELVGVWLFLLAQDRSEKDRAARKDRIANLKTAESDPSLKFFTLAGLFLGLSVGSRWCGIIGLIACLIVAFIEGTRLRSIVTMLGTAFATYLLIWIPLFLRERRPLTGIVSANLFIYRFHHYAPADPRLGEPWWTWILRLEPKPSLAYLVANPVIGWLGLLAVAALLWQRFVQHQKGRSYILSLLYLGHLGQWVVGVRPQTFYYYYFEAFTILAPTLAIAMKRLEWHKLRADVVVTACALLFFLYWYPTWANLPEPFNTLMGAH
jgi:dolichyl-phosphate-mannose-protein mannosyltransferase